ncbi:penicillin-binding protein 1A [Paenibacillus sp. JDR-2]|uniref:penicillin-binding protein 1A n=1 Tax=Paenibacillus sp. (strain JDR-2) TaxID=324057 RepID=UPI0001666CDA|nr:penicillin-binding protein 1A [Paenibacillus sp. JDR-2]ACT01265.1 penicillin-binding protein, 1A family [Paenibacillus sp. JDR-2]
MAEQPRRSKQKEMKRGTVKKKKRMTPRKWFFAFFFTIVFAIVCGIIGYLFITLNGERILTENADKLELGEASIIYDADGKEVTKLYDASANREIAEYDEMPKLLLDAFVATEDQRFYEHSGIDFFSIGRAVVKDVIARSKVEGASTITQQLAKNIFLTADKTFFRKATEASIAVALENKYSKQEILTMYLNRITFGKGIYGIKGAADYYFDTDLKDLKLWQIATLAGMPKAPNRYNPINDPESSMTRRAVVLKLMYDQKLITQQEMEEAKAVVYEPPANIDQKKSDPYKAYVDYVIEEAVKVMPGMTEDELRIGGYRIYTSLNTTAQQAVEKEFADDSNFEKSPDDQKAQGAMIIMDHRDGTIQAMSGGRDYVRKGLNRVEVKRQPGSSFKPIVSYGPALESGDYYPWTVLNQDSQKCFGDYCPRDPHGAAPVTMQQAIKESRNLAAVWTLNQVGIGNGIAFAKKLGIELAPEDRNLAIALGGLTQGVTPMQMAEAYSVFANGGKSVDPHTITKIETAANKKVYTYHAPAAKQLMKPETAWYMTQMMQTVLESGGTGTGARIDRPVAGKTGTSQHGIPNFNSSANRDAWFVGYTPEWTAAVWMGYDKTDKQHVIKKSSSQAAAMFGKVMKQAMKNVPKSSFKQPEGIKQEVKEQAPVTNFNAVFLEDQAKVQLSWTAPENSKGVTYRVYRKDSEQSQFSVFVDVANPTVDDMTVFPGMKYQYYVVAYNSEEDKESKPSETITIDVPETEVDIPEQPMEPDQPSDGELPGDGNNGGEISPPPSTDPNQPVESETPGNGGTVSPGPGNNGNGTGNGNGNGTVGPDQGAGGPVESTDPGTGNGTVTGKGTTDKNEAGSAGGKA